MVYYLIKLRKKKKKKNKGKKNKEELSLGNWPALYFTVCWKTLKALVFDTCIPALLLLREPHD